MVVALTGEMMGDVSFFSSSRVRRNDNASGDDRRDLFHACKTNERDPVPRSATVVLVLGSAARTHSPTSHKRLVKSGGTNGSAESNMSE